MFINQQTSYLGETWNCIMFDLESALMSKLGREESDLETEHVSCSDLLCQEIDSLKQPLSKVQLAMMDARLAVTGKNT